MTMQQIEALDKLTNAATAFETWAELESKMASGYCPTILPNTKRKRDLARVIKARGYKVWQGRN